MTFFLAINFFWSQKSRKPRWIKAVVPKWCVMKGLQVCHKRFLKNYLGSLNFVVLMHELQRERKSMSLGTDLFFGDHHDFWTKIKKLLTNFQ